jgi:hypothetical protein
MEKKEHYWKYISPFGGALHSAFHPVHPVNPV